MLAITCDRRDHVTVQTFAPQVEKTVAQAEIFRRLLRSSELQGEHIRVRKDLHVLDD